ncbi:hypothetical protein DFH09DRAFT_1313084 [Mycena vulgaris]|nr:hypothetical protein DFH09DRAFT_1313084 [Mycena vulgaris]
MRPVDAMRTPSFFRRLRHRSFREENARDRSRGARIPPHPPKSSSCAPSYGRIPYSPRAPLVPAYTHPRPPPRMPPPSNENAQACMCSGRGARAIAMESPSPRRLHPSPFATAPLLLTASPLHPLCPPRRVLSR